MTVALEGGAERPRQCPEMYVGTHTLPEAIAPLAAEGIPRRYQLSPRGGGDGTWTDVL